MRTLPLYPSSADPWMIMTPRISILSAATVKSQVPTGLRGGRARWLRRWAFPGYDEARTLWNAMADRHPGLIVECANTADVVRSVEFAEKHGLLVSVGGAGHSIAGNAACDDGFKISPRKMKAVQVDVEGRKAWVVMRKAPPLPFLPEEVHGTEVVILAVLYAGDMADGEEAFKALREFGNPIADVISPHQFTDFQQAFDPLLAPGERNYWKSHDFLALSDGLLDAALPFVGTLPSDGCEVFFAHIGGGSEKPIRSGQSVPVQPERETFELGV